MEQAAQILPKLEELKSVHIVGVCGTLMGAFAAFLKRRGIRVTGSDQNVYPPMSDVLAQAGVQVFNGYSAENLRGLGYTPDLVVVANVITRANVEAQEALNGNYRATSLPEAMEKLMLPETRNLVVSGTHGKTTTSSILAHVLVQVGRNPSYFIGGVSLDLPQSFHVSNVHGGTPFVLEGDEYDTAFWDKVPKFNHYLPDDVILTSVEFDHADIYPDLAAVERAFEGLLARIRPGGRLIACTDYASVRKLLPQSRVPVLTYGSDATQGARFTPGKIHSDGEATVFEVLENGKPVDEVRIQVPGRHNVMNALAVWILCRESGVPAADLRQALASFRGVKRRQEVRGEVRQVLVIDDFAHHPTAVRETLAALKMKYPNRRLVAVFEPRSATSRRKVFQKDFAKAFAEQADQSWVSVPFDQSKIAATDQFSSDQLVADIRNLGRSADLMPTVEEGVKLVAQASRSGDLVAVLSNGGFEGFIPKLLKALEA